LDDLLPYHHWYWNWPLVSFILSRWVCDYNTNGTYRNAVVPVWSAETSHHSSRGAMLAMEFTVNIFGVVVAVRVLYIYIKKKKRVRILTWL
jgi:hypothetical protein